MAGHVPRKFAGHNMLCPYEEKGCRATRQPNADVTTKKQARAAGLPFVPQGKKTPALRSNLQEPAEA